MLFNYGCKSLKNKAEKKTNVVERVETKRAGDTLTYEIPNVVYRDTTIYVRNFEKQGSNTLRIAYDQQGNQTAIDCISDEINELKEIITNTEEKTKVKETDFKTSTILYVFLGLIGLLIVNKLMNKFV
jgi:hypothetical protein